MELEFNADQAIMDPDPTVKLCGQPGPSFSLSTVIKRVCRPLLTSDIWGRVGLCHKGCSVHFRISYTLAPTP